MTASTTLQPSRWRDVFIHAQDGLRLHARDQGPTTGGRLPLICLPGLSRNAADFEEIADALASGPAARRVVSVDYRGRGLSAWDPNPANYDIRVENGDILALLAALDIGHAVFLGTSRGGLLTMAMGAARPGAIRGVVLNDIGPIIDARGLLRIRGYVGKLPLPRSFAEGA
ncbi:MAG: alpha/beta fold hydrolase, partial [Hyphomicrobiales bacterium]